MENLMLNLDRLNLKNAVAKARQVHPKVKMIADRVYAVIGKNDTYTVRFSVAGGKKLGCCTCPAGRSGMACYHLVSAATANMLIQGMRQAAQAA